MLWFTENVLDIEVRGPLRLIHFALLLAGGSLVSTIPAMLQAESEVRRLEDRRDPNILVMLLSRQWVSQNGAAGTVAAAAAAPVVAAAVEAALAPAAAGVAASGGLMLAAQPALGKPPAQPTVGEVGLHVAVCPAVEIPCIRSQPHGGPCLSGGSCLRRVVVRWLQRYERNFWLSALMFGAWVMLLVSLVESRQLCFGLQQSLQGEPSLRPSPSQPPSPPDRKSVV